MSRLCVWLCAALVAACVAAGYCPSATAQSAAAVVSAVRGCAATVGNSTSGCSFNDTIFIYGTNLPIGSGISVVISGTYYAASVTSYNSSAVSARLPYIGSSFGGTFSVQVRNSTVSSNAAALVMYTSQTPEVWRVTGCPVNDYTANSTSGCQAGMVVTIDGHHFVSAADYPYKLYANMNGESSSTCTFISTARILCTLPSVPSIYYYNVWLWVQVFAGSLNSPAAYRVMYGSYSSSSSATGRLVASSSSGAFSAPSAVISSIVGCTLRLDNGASGCGFNDTVFIHGSNLPTGGAVYVVLLNSSAYYATNIVSYNSSALSARLPYTPTFSISTYSVQVRNSTVSSNAAALVTYTSQIPGVWRVTGCPVNNVVVNGTSDCQAGMVVTIDGHHFLPPPTYYFEVFIVGYVSTCTFISTSRLLCALPVIVSAYYNTWLPVRVAAGSFNSDSAYLVRYASPSSSSSTGRFVVPSSTGGIVATPTISAVRGCAVQSGSATSSCSFNDTVFIYGTNLPIGSGISVVVSGTYYADGVRSYNSSALSARLPYIGSSLATTYSVQVRSSNTASNNVSYVTYASQTPAIYRIFGCPVNYTSTSTSGCMSGMVVTIDGDHFVPTTVSPYNLYVSVDGQLTFNCTFVSITRVLCTLPSLSSSRYNTWLSIQVWSGYLGSNSAYLVRYNLPPSSSSSSSSSTGGQSAVSISGVSGCSTPGQCVAGDLVVLSGSGFVYTMELSVLAQSTYYPCTNVICWNSNTIGCFLPAVPVSSSLLVQLQVYNGGSVLGSIWLYYYPTRSSTGGAVTPSAPGNSSSKSGLTLSDLIAIVLVVVLVVGLLLLCQVLYCLHHFAGVKFPRLARLTGGRLFAVAEVGAVEGAGIDLSLLAHNHHHQQQHMLREEHAQPLSVQPSPIAAASYQSPAYRISAPYSQPAPAAQYPAASPPPPAPAPYLYPRSFVPSPQYYQPVS